MNMLVICVAMAAVGIDVGWQRLPEGGVEYIIQLDPQTLEVLRAGEPIQSDIPPNAGEVRSYRIVVGTQKLPRDEAPAGPPVTKRATPANSADKLFPEKRAIFEQPKDAPAADKPPAKTTAEDETAKPWLPLTFALLGLTASLSANVYLGWIVAKLRQRWRATQAAGTAGGSR